MPHACVKCKQIHPDQSEVILKGCTCGSHVFSLIKTDLPTVKLSFQVPQTQPIEEIVGLTTEKSTFSIDQDGPENIRVIEPGSYELNVPSLFKGDPVILRTDSDVYYVKLPAPKQASKLKT